MSTGRLIARAAVSAVASLALVTGVAPGGLATASAAEVSAACAAERGDVAKAKKKVKKAKKAKKKAVKKVKAAKKTRTKADDNKAKKAKKKAVKKLKKAKKNLKTQKQQQAGACAAPDNAADLSRLLALFEALKKAQTTASGTLPPQVGEPLGGALDGLIAQLQALEGLLPDADPAALADIAAQVQQFDQLATALQGFASQLSTLGGGGSPQLLLEALVAGVPGVDLGALDGVKSGLTDLAAGLEAFDPTQGTAQLASLQSQVTAATAALRAGSVDLQTLNTVLALFNGGSAPADLATVTTLLSELAALDGGVLPTDVDVITDLLTVALGEVLSGAIPTSALPGGLGDLVEGIQSGTLPLDSLPAPVQDLVEGIIGGLLP